MIVTLDGPASSGKGTVARLLAQHMKAFHLDSGLLYRAFVYFLEEKNIVHTQFSPEFAQEYLQNFQMEYDFNTQKSHIIDHNHTDIAELLRHPQIGQKASKIAHDPRVRNVITDKIRLLEQQFPFIVADGRDMGSVVFPHAAFHFYLDASLSVRSHRRHQELLAKGIGMTLEQVMQDLAQRDQQDSSRTVAPLQISEDSKVIHTDCLSPKDILEQILRYMG